MTDRAAAWKATQRAFAGRFLGMPRSFSRSNYTGDFPVGEVVDEAIKKWGLPKTGNLKDHQRAWDNLQLAFESVWAELSRKSA